MHISRSIVLNVGEDVIKNFLNYKDVPKEKLLNGQNMEMLISDLIKSKHLKVKDINHFFFEELMFGKRRYQRIYKLNSIKNIKYEEDWYKPLKEQYDIPSLEFNNVLSTLVSKDEPRKIAAIHTEYNEEEEINRISILFVCYIALKDKGNSCCYIPVEFDLLKKRIVIKAWRRQGVLNDEEYKPTSLMDSLISWLEKNLKYTKKIMSHKHKETLYNMTESLVEELFDKIPSYKDSVKLTTDINTFSNLILRKMNLENKICKENGEYSIPIGVMDVKDELLKLIQRISVSDYFMNREYEEAWEMGISAMVNSVKFNDREDILAVVSGAEKRKPVFGAKSFLVLLKSLEESKAVETIWIAFKYNKKLLRVNYDASKNDYYLEIGLLSNQREFTRDEFEYIWEVLTRYESDNNLQAKKLDRAIVG
jgi:hypothetical protein